MISMASKTIPSLVLAFIVVALSTGVAAQQRQPMTIIRLYTGSGGQTYKENVGVKFSPTTLYPKAEASEAVEASEAQFFRLPKGEV